MEDFALWFVPIVAILALLFAGYLAIDVLKSDTGDERMREVGGFIYEGAMAFIRRQYRTIALLAILVALIVSGIVGIFGREKLPDGGHIEGFDIAWRTGVAFVIGAAMSAIAGIIGLVTAVKSNVRTASAATRSLGEALRIGLRGGAVTGFTVTSLSLLGVYVLYLAYGGLDDPQTTPYLIVGYGFGASFVALFALLGGGIYTKAADVAADLVGKVEARIPEDDPRNAAVVADLVGDNVGDCAGRGADLFESTAAENIGSMILGISLYLADPNNSMLWILFPLVVRAVGILASLIGLLAVRGGTVSSAQRNLDIGFWTTAVLSIAGLAAVTFGMFESFWLFAAGVTGVVTTILFYYITQYYTAGEWRPVRNIADAARTGPATIIIAGIAIGFENTALPVLVLVAALGSSYFFGIEAVAELGLAVPSDFIAGVYGTAVATMGMLMSAAYILAMDTFGPISDNAGGIAEFSHAGKETRDITDSLDSVGNTTKALTKGYAVGSAALTAFVLLSAFIQKAEIASNVINLADVRVFIGAFLGAMVVYLFCALAIRAVGVSSSTIIEEVRRQFRENPGIMTGEVRPEYGRAVDIAAASALRNMILPGLLPVIAPLAVGLILRAEASAGFLMIGAISGVVLGLVLNNGGGAWDNAKKFIEAGGLKDRDGNPYPKGSDEHAAAVVGDTVGDPFKDTAGPSLNVLIKILSTITLVLTPLFV